MLWATTYLALNVWEAKTKRERKADEVCRRCEALSFGGKATKRGEQGITLTLFKKEFQIIF